MARVDFGKLRAGVSTDTTKSPRELFNLLPKKAPRYTYLRDVQAEVLDQWSDRRGSRDLTIKMNTGSGKTVVGLLLLKNCLNDGVGPAVYVAPSPHLAQQVMREAEDLGIEVTDEIRSARFQSGKAILVINIYHLISGKSIFGIGDQGIKVRIGSIIIDDAHACLDAAEEQFTLTITKPHHVYDELLKLFEEELGQQSPSGVLDIKAEDPHKVMLVPFWAWVRLQNDVQQILRKHQTDRELEWALPLLKDHLHLCRCAFGAGQVEIAPRCLPITMIPSFVAASRRIFMSATFRDESVLVTHFDADPESIRNVITPSSGGDIGDRMILVPQEANPQLDDEELRDLFHEFSRNHNVVVIVPSNYRARFWSNVATKTLTSSNLDDGVRALQKGHVGLVVLVNKYDGIDLPNEACRVLVIDGLPDVRRKLDKLDQAALAGSQFMMNQAVQRIEQGMGRGIRSKDDHCAVFLMGRSLTSHLYTAGALNSFTAATRAQLDISNEMASQLRHGKIDDFKAVIESFLERDVTWITASRAAVIGAEYNNQASFSPAAIHERRAFNAATISDFVTAKDEMQQAINGELNPRVKAWLKIEMAEYLHRINASEAQQVVKAAVAVNNQLTRPIEGIQYVRMEARSVEQASVCIDTFRQKYSNPNDLLIVINGHLDALVFEPEKASLFEETLKTVAELVGFEGERPEATSGRGPDVLWNLGHARFLVIECKNGAATDKINKHDCNQLTGSMQWFDEKYGATCVATPIIVHPARVFEYAATPRPETRVITVDKLVSFCTELRKFVTAVVQMPLYGTPAEVSRLLVSHGLARDNFVERFTLPFKTK